MLISKDMRQQTFGYAAGIVSGITYGLNPLFAKPLLDRGVAVDTMLFFRYIISVMILGLWLLGKRAGLKVNRAQLWRLTILGLLFAMSSMLLFESYNYIPAGLATTLIFIYPVLVALIMMFMKVYPTWQVWLSIVLTLLGVVVLSAPDESVKLQWQGILLACGSALAYAMYLIVVNRSRRLRTVNSQVLTLYALLIGSGVFLVHSFIGDGAGSDSFMTGLDGWFPWLCLLGLSVFPTMVSMLTLAISTRSIGATKTSVLGVFEPVTAIAVGCILFAEPLTTNIFVGIAITLVAVTFMVMTSKK